jgi:hypothetical protein
MRINPGGRLDTSDVVGRDSEISRYWSILDRQGLVLSAERRIGKTHIALKMLDECHPQFIPFYQDLEGVHSIRELLRSIYHTVEKSLPTGDRWKNRVAKWATLVPPRIGGIDVSAIHENWPALLATAFDDLVAIADDQRVLMIWDEFPLMLYNVAKREGERVAIELLDQLRSLRQQHSRTLRFLLTGSIGLHLVIRSLQKAGNANDPTNDLYSTTVPPLAELDTVALATELLKEIDVASDELPGVALAVASHVGGFPYYIHHVIDQLQQLRRQVVRSDVSDAVDRLVYDPQDTANFRNYLKRISTYYDVSEHLIALAILDGLAREVAAQSTETIINLVKHRIASAADEDIRAVLTLLVVDHYLVKQSVAGRMTYDFRWKLVKRWWRETRT